METPESQPPSAPPTTEQLPPQETVSALPAEDSAQSEPNAEAPTAVHHATTDNGSTLISDHLAHAEIAPATQSALPANDLSTSAEAGIAPVSSFLPSDAKIDQPTPSPLQPLGTGEADTREDAVMTDAPVTDALPPPTGATDAIEPPPQAIPPITNGTTPSSSSPHALSASANDADAAQPQIKDELLPEVPPAHLSQPESALPTPPAQSQPQAPSLETPVESATTSFDIQMQDSTSSLTRPREDDADDEPSAKRARLDESAILDTPIEAPVNGGINGETNGDFKRPDLPIAPESSSAAPLQPSPASLPPTNGTAISHLPARGAYSAEPLTRFQRKILEEKIKNTKKVKSAIAFLRPVDPVALNIPNYPNIITYPMDLGTMEQKLKSDQYSSLEHFVSDFEVMVNNCFTFNGPAHVVSGQAMNLRAYFLKQMDSVPTGEAAAAPPRPPKKESPVPKPQPRRESRASSGPGVPTLAKSPSGSGDTFALLPGGTPQIRRDSTAGRPKRAVIPPAPRDLPYSGSKPKRKENQGGLKFAEHVLNEMRKPRLSDKTFYFLEPVDPVALNIPHYFSVIKHPMDIQTIANKLKTGQYSAADEFKNDFELMLNNALKFNPPDNIVHASAKALQGEFDIVWKTKSKWIKDHQPRSARVTPDSDGESDEGEISAEESEPEDDAKEATIRALKAQLETMQNMLGAISGAAKRDSPKASGKKKSRPSGGASGSSKPKKSGATASSSKPAPKSKPKKQRLVTLDEKQEISNATEHMTEEQISKLTQLVVESDPKFQDKDEMELDIDDLPNDVQHKLLRYVRSIFPRATRDDSQDLGVDDDYEPERNSKSGGGGGARKKHKPMKKHEQEERIAQLNAKVQAMTGGVAAAATGGGHGRQPESSGDEDSESSEEE